MKRIGAVLLSLSLVMVVLFTGCDEELKADAKKVAKTYNTLVEEYNENIKPYNTAVDTIKEKNDDFNEVIDGAQAVLDKGEKPFDEKTKTKLKKKIVSSNDKVVSLPKKIAEKKTVKVKDDWGKGDLEDFIKKTKDDTQKLKKVTIPETPKTPNYTKPTKALKKALKNYEDSVQGLKQITAPKDKFVLKRLQRVKTITSMKAVTEDHDPNGMLNKQGGYIGCIYFTDSRVDRSEVDTSEGTGCIDVGNEGGGTVEIFATEKEAKDRDDYLTATQGIAFARPGSHYVRGTCVIRTSEHLKASEQTSLTDAVTEVLIAVK